jgi:predicted Zn-dependent peptidase
MNAVTQFHWRNSDLWICRISTNETYGDRVRSITLKDIATAATKVLTPQNRFGWWWATAKKFKTR